MESGEAGNSGPRGDDPARRLKEQLAAIFPEGDVPEDELPQALRPGRKQPDESKRPDTSAGDVRQDPPSD